MWFRKTQFLSFLLCLFALPCLAGPCDTCSPISINLRHGAGMHHFRYLLSTGYLVTYKSGPSQTGRARANKLVTCTGYLSPELALFYSMRNNNYFTCGFGINKFSFTIENIIYTHYHVKEHYSSYPPKLDSISTSLSTENFSEEITLVNNNLYIGIGKLKRHKNWTYFVECSIIRQKFLYGIVTRTEHNSINTVFELSTSMIGQYGNSVRIGFHFTVLKRVVIGSNFRCSYFYNTIGRKNYTQLNNGSYNFRIANMGSAIVFLNVGLAL